MRRRVGAALLALLALWLALVGQQVFEVLKQPALMAFVRFGLATLALMVAERLARER